MASTLSPRRAHALERWREPRGLIDEIENTVSRLWEDGYDGWFGGRGAPSLDISETDTAIEAKLDLPGVKPADIDIQLNGSVLTVSGERKEAKEHKGKTYLRVERRAGSFSRSFTLPFPVAEDEVAAAYHDGVLTITLPKTEEAKTRKIAVRS